jgi:choline dehydrogenase-like flavoprotein
VQSFDYLIVGGGSAGCVLAARLSENPNVRVALLEAGPPDHSVLIHCPAGLAVLAKNGQANWAFDTVPQAALNGRRGYQPRGKVLGGSSSVNAMVYIRGHRSDYDHWAAQGNAGWGYDDVLPYFKRAEHNERGADAWHGTGGPLNVMDLRSPNRCGPVFVDAARQAGYAANPDFNAAEQEGVGLYQVTHRNGERFSAAKAYLAPARSRSNLTVITDVRVTRILTEGRRATGVEFIQAGGKQRLGASREVLLCAALQSPQLLMLSGIARATIATPRHHPRARPGRRRPPPARPPRRRRWSTRRISDCLSVVGVVRVLQGMLEWRAIAGMLTTNFARPAAHQELPERADSRSAAVLRSVLIDHGRNRVWPRLMRRVCLLRPKSRGRVTLASADPTAAPRIDPNFLAERDDVDRLVRGFKLMRAILSQRALSDHGGRELETSAAAQTDEQIEAFVRAHADTIYHPVGSCRMGPGPLDVVDAQLCVHGMQGLRVVDASIMPRIVGGNTNAPTIMIAEKASDSLRAA